jgi:hypothetical protein
MPKRLLGTHLPDELDFFTILKNRKTADKLQGNRV